MTGIYTTTSCREFEIHRLSYLTSIKEHQNQTQTLSPCYCQGGEHGQMADCDIDNLSMVPPSRLFKLPPKGKVGVESQVRVRL